MGLKAAAIVLLLGLVALSDVRAQGSCRNPRGEYGSCINLKQCPQLLNILTGERRPDDIEFLKASQCGFENRDPLVCCVPVSGGTGSGRENPTEGRFPTTPSTGVGNSSGLLPENCGIQESQRIVGGEATELDEFPWMVLLEYSKPGGMTTACGGTLISKRYVLTAAHCLKGASLPVTWRLMNVRLGEYNTATDPDCIPNGAEGQICADPAVSVPIEELIVHEQYEPRSAHQRNDIALLRLARDVTFTDYVRPVCLPTTGTIGDLVVAAGWGKTEDRYASDVKLKVSLKMANKEACDAVYASQRVPLGQGQICAGGERGKDSCRGDSGGPLMQQMHDANRIGRWYSVGVVSFGPSPCGMQNWPGVYTKVYDFVPWIQSKLRP